MVNHPLKGARKDNEKQNESRMKPYAIPVKEIYDSYAYIPKSMWFESMSETEPGTRLRSMRDILYTGSVSNILLVGTET